MPEKNPYRLLGVPRDASEGDLRKAYRRLAREHHPDANPDDPRAEGRFKEIQHTYETLSDPEQRRDLDASLQRAPSRARTGGARTGGARASGGGASPDTPAGSPQGPSGGRRGSVRDLRGEDALRVARLLGVDLDRLSKRLGGIVTVRTNASFGGAGREAPAAGRRAPGGTPPPGGEAPPVPHNLPIPPKPPIPPKTRKVDDGS